ncbi:hypothetical protein H4R26_003545 [Coemansia thaxteri]|uniref:Prenylcysteine lyase domain-containing protein n=1 Tax=Coemansia thaxteri TaxID=2663907 RepID=A0A9W8BHW0_9FUNG|nr:hypothetical protein H4R26_003545 [Coemansia thaxteri]
MLVRLLLALAAAWLRALGSVVEGGQRIAIIGAGAAGASAAYFAQEELRARGMEPAEIHVYERSGRVGGRAQVGSVQYNNQTLYFEQGASMFIGQNRHLMAMALKFDLALCSHPCTFGHSNSADMAANGAAALGAYGLWEPRTRQWEVRMGSGPMLDSLRLLWRYRGVGDLGHVRRHTRTAVDEFMQSYEVFDNSTGGAYESWAEYLLDKPLLRMSAYYSAAEFYIGERVRRRFLDEVVSLATRVNYMQDIDRISAAGAHISMAAESDTAYSVAGGNWQIFAAMLAATPAHLHLNATVLDVQRAPALAARPYALRVRLASGDEAVEHFDSVIIATPLPLARMRVLDGRHTQATAVDYVSMHVTFVIGVLRSDLFPPSTDVPRLVVTPYHTAEPFNCLSILACLDPAARRCRDGPVLAKVFSREPLSVPQVFASVEWVRRKQWHAYPRLTPRNAGYANASSSGAFSLDRPSPPPIVLDRPGPAAGVYYVNGMESLFSTMESQSVAARHVVRLALFGKDK